MAGASEYDRPDVVNQITPLSEISDPPEGCRLLAPLYWSVSIILTLVMVAGLLAVSPILLTGMMVRSLSWCRVKYHTEPKDMRIAIIGGGWAGLQTLRRLRELGVENAVIFERMDGLGGTWHINGRYHGQQLHSPPTISSMFSQDKAVMYSKDEDQNLGKLRGDEYKRYLDRFVVDHDDMGHCQLNSKVVGVKMNSSNRTAMLTVERTGTGSRDEEGPFDFVIFASTAGAPNFPRGVDRDAFAGEQYHTLEWKTETFDRIVSEGKKVLVVGGSKASTDMVMNFERAGYKNVMWAFKKPYMFIKYEELFMKRSCGGMVSGFMTLIGLFYSMAVPALTAVSLWGKGAFCSFGAGHLDMTKFTFGLLCSSQRRILAGFPAERRVVGANVKKLTATGAQMQDGRHVEADVIIWATGNSTSLADISLEKDGRPFKLQDDTCCYNHYVVPAFPVLASGVALLTCFGPVRGINMAELALYHLCVAPHISEEKMERSAKWNLSFNPVLHSFIWGNGCFMKNWLFLFVDLILRGILPAGNLVKHFVEIFVLGYQTAVGFSLLPHTPMRAAARNMEVPLTKTS